MRINKIEPLKKGLVNVIIETPRGSQNKFAFDPELKVFKLKKTLPMGTVFPFDFGFIPGTEGEDGDPLDVLVIMDEPTYPGTLVECRLIGALLAKQKEKDGKEGRNDRIVAISDCSVLYGGIQHPNELNKGMIHEIENFFIDYNKHEGKEFTPVGWTNSEDSLKLIKEAMSGK
jgi:inorganic pyrophosphatase